MDVATISIRLTREEFRALAKAKGWKFTMLAARWGVTPEWVSNISRDPQRDLRYDDALYGLPNLHHLKRDLRHRSRELSVAVQEQQARRATRSILPAPGHRYRGYLMPGTVVTVATAFGSIAEEGQRGIVFQVDQRDGQEFYDVVFENGEHDWFAPDAVDRYLVATGLIATGAVTYHYRSAAALAIDVHSGAFDFWPEVTPR